ncbi:tryptophan--tRNA ligase [Microbacteriaceae bacterium 4G12]
MSKPVVLTGIKSTGHPHLGNYIGAIKPALEMAKRPDMQGMYFIADYHALNAVQDPKQLNGYTYEVAATWLALGLDPNQVIFYRQSDVPEILELHWILSCFTPKGLMNRAHAYKAVVEKNKGEGLDPDTGVNMGLFTYPILMSADILMFHANFVPVGKDQIQHVEIARDIVSAFNHTYGDILTMPQYVVQEESAVLPGLDGRKMSKSYGNTILLFDSPEQLKKKIFKIKTDSSLPTEPKNPDTSTLFLLYREFATSEETNEMRRKYKEGIGWGTVKQEVFEVINRELEKPRERYQMYMENKMLIDEILQKGAKQARQQANIHLQQIKKSIGY